jgi:hypothetical protein
VCYRVADCNQELCERTSRSYTCVRIVEALPIVINDCVLNFGVQ